MGWLYTRRDPDTTPAEYFLRQIDKDLYEVLGHATYISEIYLAIRNRKTDEVTALVCLIRHVPKDPQFNFGYKDMDESMGPVATNCPAWILDLLTEPPNEHAREWRERCRERIAERERAKAIVTGSRIRITQRLEFLNGHVIEAGDVVTVTRRGRMLLAGGYYRLPPIHRLSWEPYYEGVTV